MRYLPQVVLILLAATTWTAAVAESAEPGIRTVDKITSDWNVRDHVPLDEFIVQSHRGAGKLEPENTLRAFQLSWKMGTVPEADLRTTKDGVIVAFHDGNFKRLVKNASPELKKKSVSDLSWAEIQTLDVGEGKGKEFIGCRIPSLDDILAQMIGHPKRRLYLDIKNIELGRLAKKVAAANVESQVILASTDYALIRKWKRLTPKSGTLLWMGGSEKVLAERIAELRRTNFADIVQLQIHVVTEETNRGKKISPSASFLVETGKELRRHGILYQALPWHRSDAQVYWQLMDLGVASFASDYPDKTMEAIRQYYMRRTR